LLTADYYTGTYNTGTNVPAKDFGYAYDTIGDRTSYTPGTQSPATTYTSNSQDEYTATAYPTESFGYDYDGNLTTDDASGTANDWTYTWDAENRLVEARAGPRARVQNVAAFPIHFEEDDERP